MATSPSGAGGKIVTNRRKQRLAVAPYDRPPPPNSPNWFAGVVVPSARAIASGAGKILSSIFSESGTSSSEDEEYGSGAPSSAFIFFLLFTLFLRYCCFI